MVPDICQLRLQTRAGQRTMSTMAIPVSFPVPACAGQCDLWLVKMRSCTTAPFMVTFGRSEHVLITYSRTVTGQNQDNTSALAHHIPR